MSVCTANVRAQFVAPVDDRRGTMGMLLFIATEAALFALLFFSYYFLAIFDPEWPRGEPPNLWLALPMLAVLLLSSIVLHRGERVLKRGDEVRARLAVSGTLVLGVAFVVLQIFEYRERLRTLSPQSSAYGSIFYAITSFHAAHLALGLLMLLYVLVLPRLEPTQQPPHRPLHNTALYWHFVDLVWVVIVGLLYAVPNLPR
jgi:heme/copper-type cytochrome/quinol oxidase subunit 3